MQMQVTFNSYDEMKEFIDRIYIGGEAKDAEQKPQSNPGAAAAQPAATAPVNQQAMPQGQFQMNPVPPMTGYQGAVPQQTGMPATGTTVPTTAMAQQFSYDQLAVAAAGLVNMGKQQNLMGVLQKFGVAAMTELPKERYGEFATAIRAEGAVI